MQAHPDSDELAHAEALFQVIILALGQLPLHAGELFS